MTVTSSYSTNWTTTEWSSKEEEYRIYDTLLAVILSLCTVVGLPGNLLSFFYFYSASRRDFSSFIYTIVSAIDICTCVVHFPVMVALFNARKPGLFGNMTFCVTWIVVYNYVQFMSMFLVMLLSVSRSITLNLLQYKIKKKYLTTAYLTYSLFLITWQTIAHVCGGKDKWYGYHPFDVLCWRDLHLKPLSEIDQLVRAICIGLPPVLTTISFTLVTYKLLQKRQVSKMNKRKHQAVVNMALFTALFLVCNLPCLLNNITWFVNELLYDKWPGPIYSRPFLAYYSWVISDVVCTVLNASLNPCLYLSRMDHLRKWASTKVSQRSQNRVSSKQEVPL